MSVTPLSAHNGPSKCALTPILQMENRGGSPDPIVSKPQCIVLKDNKIVVLGKKKTKHKFGPFKDLCRLFPGSVGKEWLGIQVSPAQSWHGQGYLPPVPFPLRGTSVWPPKGLSGFRRLLAPGIRREVRGELQRLDPWWGESGRTC